MSMSNYPQSQYIGFLITWSYFGNWKW